MKKLGFGLMRLPLSNALDSTDINMKEMARMVDLFINSGFTYFDTAWPYHNGHSETAFRESVAKRYSHTQFTVTDKMPCWEVQTEADLEHIFNQQLERCGVEYFDYYWLHALNKSYYQIMQRVDGFGFISRKKAEGKIRHIGFSFHDEPALLEEILKDHPEVEYVQLQINYLDWLSPTVQSKACYDICTKHQKPIIVMEPVKGGSLATVPESVEKMFRDYNPTASSSSWAVRYAASLPNVMMVLSGMSNYEQMQDNTHFMKDFIPLNEREQEIIGVAEGIINHSIAIPCTACHYCTDGCPQNICIPEYFNLYNTIKHFGHEQQWMNTSVHYAMLSKTHGLASDCIACGQCEDHCPQHLPIIENLKDVVQMFEH